MIAQIITFVATVATAMMIFLARSAARSTTLITAWTWAAIASAAWCIAALGALISGNAAPAVGRLWYVAAVLTLCPWIAVLGARRPTVRVWNWFVLVPLVAVLLWPVALCWMPRGPYRLVLETPQLVGFGLVLLMGVGNFLGTRHSLLAIITALAEFLLIAALDSRNSTSAAGAWLIAVASIAVFSGVLGAWGVRPSDRSPPGWDRLWNDFRDTFGIVWANRIGERVNSEAAKAAWPVRLQSHGFVSVDPTRPIEMAAVESRIDHTLRWLLRRFVDDEWIARRLPDQAAPGLKDGGSLAGNDSIDVSST